MIVKLSLSSSKIIENKIRHETISSKALYKLKGDQNEE